MEYRRLGRTDLEVSVVGFGAIRANGADGVRDMLEAGRKLGINLVDTARAYPRSEEMLGIAMEGHRAEHIITSRTQSRDYAGAEADLATGLEMLKTDYIDIYQIHDLKGDQLDTVLADDGVARLLQDAKKDGRIRSTGLSSHHLDVAAKAVLTGLFDTLVIPFSPVEYSAKHLQLIQVCKDLDVGVVAMKPMSGGSFVSRISDNISFIMQHDIASAITGMGSPDEMKQNAEAGSNLKILNLEEFDSLMAEAAALGESFCRRCGYCLPCKEDIPIREIMMSDAYLRGNPRMVAMFGGEVGQKAFAAKVDECTECGECIEKCPYALDIPNLMPGKVTFFAETLASLS